MTQPERHRREPARQVKVIVELIDHTSKIADANERGDLVERLARAKDPDHRSADPGGDRRAAQAGQEPAAQLTAERPGVARRRRREHRAADGGVLQREHFGQAHRRAARWRGARSDRDPDGRHQDRSAPRPAGGWARGAAGRGHRREPAYSRTDWRSWTHRESVVTVSRTCRRRWACCPMPMRC